MIRNIKSEELKVGMFVQLGANWLHHSFLRPNFIITSESQIKKIIGDGIREVKVDTEKSRLRDKHDLIGDLALPDDYDNTAGRQEFEAPKQFNPIAAISEELKNALADHNAPAQKKAKAVYNNSIKMMDNILSQPNMENILAGKRMIYDTVDHILGDDDTADALTRITSHDYYTYTHSVNVGLLSVLLAKNIFSNSRDHDMKELGAGFFLHDLGKCDVPYTLINKPSRLSPDEWKVMRNHPSRGNRILSETNQLSKECGVIVMQHHEREDGSGYPFGLARDEIHLYGRICSIADVYDALTSTRAYKKKLPPFQALQVMKDEMLHHFNAEIFQAFVRLFSGN